MSEPDVLSIRPTLRTAAIATHPRFCFGDDPIREPQYQLLPHPGQPVLREPCVLDARRYIELAERADGPIPRPYGFLTPWGEALCAVDDIAPDVRLINLETTITADGTFAAGKSVHYRMHPDNLPALTAFRPDTCALSNNHSLDFGRRGLADTLDTLARAGIRTAGAGRDLAAARRAARVPVPGGRRVLIASVSTLSSGVPADWAATDDRAGVWLIDRPCARRADEVAARLLCEADPGDHTVVSVHWGPNWDAGPGMSEREFAHRLVDAGVDIVHGHSAHHPRAIEIYRGTPILYGCGDVIDDYAGIGGHESYRPELRLLYIVTLAPDEAAVVRMLPLHIRRMRLERAGADDTQWLRARLGDLGYRLGTRIDLGHDGMLTAHR